MHDVRIWPDGLTTCSCPRFTEARKECSHVRQVLLRWTQAGRSGALVEAAQTDGTVATERALQTAEVEGVTLGTLIAERNAAETGRVETSKITRGW